MAKKKKKKFEQVALLLFKVSLQQIFTTVQELTCVCGVSVRTLLRSAAGRERPCWRDVVAGKKMSRANTQHAPFISKCVLPTLRNVHCLYSSTIDSFSEFVGFFVLLFSLLRPARRRSSKS